MAANTRGFKLMQAKRKAVVLLIGVLVPIFFLLVIQGSTRPEIPLAELLASTPSFPETWSSSMGTVSITWEIAHANFSIPPNAALRSDSNLGRTWANAEQDNMPATSIVTIQQVYHYPNPMKALVHYYIARPEIAEFDNWPNFVIRDAKKNRYPQAWTYHSPYADQEHVVCGIGMPRGCSAWFYWARYGQYLMEVRFFAPSRGISQELFAEIVAEFDTFVGPKLE
jgi:hypothetical protein